MIAIIALAILAVMLAIALISSKSHSAPSAEGQAAGLQAIDAQQRQAHASGMPLQQPYHQPGAPHAGPPGRGSTGAAGPIAVYPGAHPIPGAPDFYSTPDKPEQVEVFYRTLYPEARVSTMQGRTAMSFAALSGEVNIEIAQAAEGTHVWIRRR